MNPALSEKVHIKRIRLYRKSTISPINWVPSLQHSVEVLGIQLWVTLLELSETLFLFFEGKVGVVKDTVHHGDQGRVCALGGLFLVLIWSHLTAVGVICKIIKINIISKILNFKLLSNYDATLQYLVRKRSKRVKKRNFNIILYFVVVVIFTKIFQISDSCESKHKTEILKFNFQNFCEFSNLFISKFL